MQDVHIDDYILKITCDGAVVLIPLSSVVRIMDSKDEGLKGHECDKVTYQDREIVRCTLAELLGRQSHGQERYVILLQDEDMEAALYVEDVQGIVGKDCPHDALPSYLTKRMRDVVLSIYRLEGHTLAYCVDIMKILKQLYALREDECYEK